MAAITRTSRKHSWARMVIASALALFATAARADASSQITSRAQAATIIANARKILTPHGVERLEKVRIGGIDQWVLIRGRDTRNPVLLVILGGPRYILMPMGWWSARDREEYFAVVQWDQRGSGKTLLINDRKAVAPTMTLGRTVADAEEMTNWLRKEFGKKKIFVLGHSAGTFAGLQLAERELQAIAPYFPPGKPSPLKDVYGWARSAA
jgi:predicted alpha/beta-fold hydrolase